MRLSRIALKIRLFGSGCTFSSAPKFDILYTLGSFLGAIFKPIASARIGGVVVIKIRKFWSAFVACGVVTFLVSLQPALAAPTMRGFQVPLEAITAETLDDLVNNWGVNVLRAQVGDNTHMDGTTGAAYDSMMEQRFLLVEEKLPLLQARGVKLIFCLSSPPGGFKTREAPSHYLMYSQPELQDAYIEKWKQIVARFGSHPAILAFDIENEPAMRSSLLAPGARNWNQLLLDTIAAIRITHPALPLIVKSLYGDPSKLSQLPAINDANVIYSYNAYPYNKYQHTGIGTAPFSIKRPTDKEVLNNIRKLVAPFFFKTSQRAEKGQIAKTLYPPKVIVGEAAVSACANEGAQFLNALLATLEKDEAAAQIKARARLIKQWQRARARGIRRPKPIFEARHFAPDVSHTGWFIHAFAEAIVWDPRYVCDAAGNVTRSSTETDKSIVAKSFFSRN
jgi:hypothetical protein